MHSVGRIAFLMVVLVTPLASPAQRPPTGPEDSLLNSANRERVSRGLPALRWDDALAAAARDHAQRMAQSNALSHQFPGEPSLKDRTHRAGASYSVIAENVAEGPSPAVIHSEWMNSAPHRANLLDPELNAIGIAVVHSGDMLFAVQDFSQSVVRLKYEEQENQVGRLITARGLNLANAGDARKACDANGSFTATHPSLVMRFETSDLTRLPREIDEKLRAGQYHSASVAACDPANADFSHYRIVIILF
jgi:Cysteine-rich secretory protein family